MHEWFIWANYVTIALNVLQEEQTSQYELGEAQVGSNSKGCGVDYRDQVMNEVFTLYRRGVPWIMCNTQDTSSGYTNK